MADGEMALSTNAARRKEQWYRCQKRRLSALQTDPDHPMHGTVAGYRYGCRCESCRAARHEYYVQVERPARRARRERTGRW